MILMHIMIAALAAGIPRAPSHTAADARATVDTAIARMGGEQALRSVTTVHYELVTQWLNASFDPRPFTDSPGYEVHSDTRDYRTKRGGMFGDFGATRRGSS